MQLSDFIKAVVQATSEVAGIESALAYEPAPEGVTVVTAWVDLESLVQTEASNDDHWSTEASVRITVAVPQDTNTKLTAWDLGVALAFHLRHQRWGLKTEPAQIVGLDRAVLADFEGRLDAVELELTQALYFRAPATASVPLNAVYAGISPDVGPTHVDDYEQVAP